MEATLYVDESGQFAASDWGPTGLRLVGGILLPGTRQEHEKTYGAAARRLFSWFPDPIHAVNASNNVAFAFALRKAKPSLVPHELRSLQSKLIALPWQELPNLRFQSPSVFEDLQKEKNELLQKLHRVIARALVLEGAALILSAEHDLGLETSRFDAMFGAAIDAALHHCAVFWPGQTTLHVVFEAGAAGHDPCSLPESKKVVKRGEAILGGMPRAQSKRDAVTGLVFADALLHVLGPGKRQNVPCSRKDCRSWSLAHLRNQLKREFGCTPSHLWVVDALQSANILDFDETGSTPRAFLKATFNQQKNKLPRGVLYAAIESSLCLLDASKDLEP